MNLSAENQKRLTALVIILALGLCAALMVLVSRNIEAVERLITSLGIAGPVLSVALYGLLGASPVPSEPLTLVNGAVFGPLMGTVIAGTGNTLAAVVEYYIGAGIDNAADFAEKRKDLPLGLGKFPADSVWFLLGGRLIPGYGAKVVSVVGGMYRVPLGRYLWTTAIPTFLGAAVFAYGGFNLLKLF